MNQQLQEWLGQMPVWVPVALAIMALLATIYLHVRWREEELDPRQAKALLVPASTVAILGSLARHIPAAADRMDAASLDQLTAFGLIASVVTLVTAAVQARRLQAGVSSGAQGLSAADAWGLENDESGPELPDQWPDPGASAAGSLGPVPQTAVHLGQSSQMGSGESPPTVMRRPSARQAQVAWLSALKGPHAGQSWVLEKETRIGRGESDACEIVLNDPAVSGGQHALIRLDDDGGYLLADLASTNGTFVNGEKVMRHSLKDKDRITVGACELVFVQARLAETDQMAEEGGGS